MDYLLHAGSIVVLLRRDWDSLFWVSYWNISNKNSFFFSWIYPFNFQIFTFLFLNNGRYLNYHSLSYFLFNFDSKYIIQRYSFLLFLQKIIITIIIRYDQFFKTRVLCCNKRFCWRFSHLSLHKLISTSLLYINNSPVFKIHLCFNCNIIIYLFLINFFILSVFINHTSNILWIVFYTSFVLQTGQFSSLVSASTRSSSPLGSWILLIFNIFGFSTWSLSSVSDYSKSFPVICVPCSRSVSVYSRSSYSLGFWIFLIFSSVGFSIWSLSSVYDYFKFILFACFLVYDIFHQISCCQPYLSYPFYQLHSYQLMFLNNSQLFFSLSFHH